MKRGLNAFRYNILNNRVAKRVFLVLQRTTTLRMRTALQKWKLVVASRTPLRFVDGCYAMQLIVQRRLRTGFTSVRDHSKSKR